ncbi:hypothetical protein LOAG_04716 [Loa loa]|uniref:Uncharacterized protein n=1 Tax=Loa loa TaxID=7209 RepID=A0A1S0U3E7_LOALO|nr:hypothetical protein LOAG_04716 [Loa loa]EFO23771.1 hypothetical protein LOAG_04716 [Loa loa]
MIYAKFPQYINANKIVELDDFGYKFYHVLIRTIMSDWLLYAIRPCLLWDDPQPNNSMRPTAGLSTPSQYKDDFDTMIQMQTINTCMLLSTLQLFIKDSYHATGTCLNSFCLILAFWDSGYLQEYRCYRRLVACIHLSHKIMFNYANVWSSNFLIVGVHDNFTSGNQNSVLVKTRQLKICIFINIIERKTKEMEYFLVALIMWVLCNVRPEFDLA